MVTGGQNTLVRGSDSDMTKDVMNSSKDSEPPIPDGFLSRLRHFTWAWYTYPMATGGLALLLSPQTQPYTFPGLDTIGKVVFIYDLIIFTLITVAISYRFAVFRGTLRASLTHPTEGLFFGTSLLSLASIIACIARYGVPSCGPWLIAAYRVLFWLYFAVTFIVAVGQYCMLFTNPALKIQDMTPAWDLPIFPVMLTGTLAAVGAALQPPDQAVPMIIAGVTSQGLGMMVSVLMYASYVRRMIQYGFPSPNSRPGMFIAVGPPSFTALALIGMASAFPRLDNSHYHYWGDAEVSSQILRVIATLLAVFIWSLSFWFFCISLVACLAVANQMSFHLNWYALVFPNVGFTIGIISIGKQLKSQGVLWVGTVMTVLLVSLYLFVLFNHVKAVLAKAILWPGKDEDVYVKEKKGKEDRLGLAADFDDKAE